MRDVRAANVEQPRNRMRIADDERVIAGQQRREAAEFPLRGLAGVLARMRADPAHRRRRPVGPDDVDGVRLDGDQFPADGLQRFVQPFDLIGRMQPGIIAKPRALAQIGLEPFARRGRRQGERLEGRGVDLIPDRQRIAPVDEDRGATLQHDGEAGRAGKAGQPGEALLGRGHIFVLVAVGARHDEAVEAKTAHFGA